jgi:hypothetical protein
VSDGSTSVPRTASTPFTMIGDAGIVCEGDVCVVPAGTHGTPGS